MTDIVKCNICGHVLISGKGCLTFFGSGASIQCMKCGNKYTFGEEKKQALKIGCEGDKTNIDEESLQDILERTYHST